jgi:hypothetical protein
MRVSSAPWEAGKKTVMEEIFVNFAALGNLVKPTSGSKDCGGIPNLILSDLSSLRHIELLSWSLIRDIVKVDVIFVRKLWFCITPYPRIINGPTYQRNLCRRFITRTCLE